MKSMLRLFVLIAGLLCLWEGVIHLWQLPDYILPTPWQVFVTLYQESHVIAAQSIPTLIGTFFYIHIPAALPALASGIRIAAVAAPIGAIVGEWVGSSRGLGYLMLNANARLQIDMMFATLLVIIFLALIIYFCVDKLLRLL